MKTRKTLHDERGSALSTGAILLVTVFTLILGIAVDLSGQVQTKRQANDVAAQAARIAGQQLDADRFLDSGGRIRLSSSAARKAAQDYIEHAGMTGTVTIDNAEIRGEFKGELTVRKRLMICATGKVSGKIAYGKLVIEEGGELIGEIQAMHGAVPVLGANSEMPVLRTASAPPMAMGVPARH